MGTYGYLVCFSLVRWLHPDHYCFPEGLSRFSRKIWAPCRTQNHWDVLQLRDPCPRLGVVSSRNHALTHTVAVQTVPVLSRTSQLIAALRDAPFVPVFRAAKATTLSSLPGLSGLASQLSRGLWGKPRTGFKDRWVADTLRPLQYFLKLFIFFGKMM